MKGILHARTTHVCVAIAALLGLAGSVSAATIANWRFEEGTNSVQHVGHHDSFYADTSGNGNHLSAWVDAQNPMATNDLPFTSRGGVTNTVALDFEEDDAQNIGTFGPGDVSDKMIDSFSFINGWTVEASFKVESRGWGVVVGKDGEPVASDVRPSLYFRVHAENDLLVCGFYDNATNWVALASLDALELDQWYNATLTYDNTTAKLYLQKGAGDYNLQRSAAVPAGASLDIEDRFWTVGRGMRNNAPDYIFDGMVDEVKISDVEVAPAGATIPFEIRPPQDVAAGIFSGWDVRFNLSASEYASTVGYAFSGSQWQLSSDSNFVSTAWDSGNVGPVTSVNVPGDTLTAGTYYARARYQGNTGVWSDWSSAALLDLTEHTISYWRFEEGANGDRYQTEGVAWYQDGSGNSNHLEVGDFWEAPSSTNDIMMSNIALVGPNTLALQFGNNPAPRLGRDKLTTSVNGPDRMIQDYAFTNGWTIECSFNMNTADQNAVIFGKDGYLDGKIDQPFAFKLLYDAAPNGMSRLACVWWWDDRTFGAIVSDDIAVTGKWHSAVASYKDDTVSLYLRSEDESEFSLVGTSTRTGGCNLCPVTIPVGIVDNDWVVGRGTREGVENYWFNGLVDEVRVSDIALQLSDFLQPPPPAPPIGDIAIQLVGTDSISLTWTTGADYSYMLMEKADLQDSTWSTNTAGIPSGINGNATVTVPATGDAGFFGVVLEQ